MPRTRAAALADVARPGACRWARSCTPAAATRAATPTSACGSAAPATTSATAGSAWLLHLVTPDHVRQLVPEAEDLDVEVFALPNLGGVNVLMRGLLGDGVAASTRFDPQAKAVGEWLRSRHVHVPEELL